MTADSTPETPDSTTIDRISSSAALGEPLSSTSAVQHIGLDPRNERFFQDPYSHYLAMYETSTSKDTLVYWEQYDMYCALSFELVNQILRDRRFARLPPGDRPADTTTPVNTTPVKTTPVNTTLVTTNPDEPNTENGAISKTHLTHFDLVESASLLNLEGKAHTRMRTLIQHAFQARQIASLSNDIIQITSQCLDQCQQEINQYGETDLLPRLATPVPATIIARMLGIPECHVPDLLAWSHAMVKVYTLTQSHDDEIAANQAAGEFADFIQQHIHQRRHSARQDLLSHLVNAEVDGQRLTDTEIVSTTILLLNAGHEATVHQIGNAIKTVLESNFSANSLWDDAKQIRATVNELMRFDAPLHLFVRFAQEPVVLSGQVSLEKGQRVAVLLGAANRDPARFTNANTFDPFRTDGNHVSMGAGVHYCIGALLARLELETVLPMVFQRFPELRFVEAPRYSNTFHFHGLEALRVRL